MRRYHDLRTAIFGALGPLRFWEHASILESDGLGAARGQRSREGPCASHPTRQYFPPLPCPHIPEAPFGMSRASTY